jgi:hypothetical protein
MYAQLYTIVITLRDGQKLLKAGSSCRDMQHRRNEIKSKNKAVDVEIVDTLDLFPFTLTGDKVKDKVIKANAQMKAEQAELYLHLALKNAGYTPILDQGQETEYYLLTGSKTIEFEYTIRKTFNVKMQVVL